MGMDRGRILAALLFAAIAAGVIGWIRAQDNETGTAVAPGSTGFRPEAAPPLMIPLEPEPDERRELAGLDANSAAVAPTDHEIDQGLAAYRGKVVDGRRFPVAGAAVSG